MRETVLNLSDIFRYSLETGRMLRPLSDELRIIKAYLEVERLRLGDKLRVEIDVSSEALEVHIPVFSIQPLVENAIKHGIAPNVDGGLVRVEVSAETERSGLWFTTADPVSRPPPPQQEPVSA